MGLLSAFAILCFLIFFHELGHFIIARACGVKVEAFSIGFWKEIIAFEFRGTRYKFCIIPLGGYVKMKGENAARTGEYKQSGETTQRTGENLDSDSFVAKSPAQKIAILLGGVGFNFLLGFLLYVVVCAVGFTALSPVVGEVVDSMPAKEAGLQKGDRILSINGESIRSFEEIGEILSRTNGEISLVLERDSVILQKTLVPSISSAKNIFGEDIKRAFIGIRASGEVQTLRFEGFEILSKALDRTLFATQIIFQSIQKLITGVISHDQISSVIGITDGLSKASESGIVLLLSFSALISINLAILNLLPIPPLDGGGIVFTLYEAIFKSPPPEKVMFLISALGISVLICVMLLGVYNDINRLIG